MASCNFTNGTIQDEQTEKQKMSFVESRKIEHKTRSKAKTKTGNEF